MYIHPLHASIALLYSQADYISDKPAFHPAAPPPRR